MTPIAIQPQKQGDADCAVIALAMFYGMPYSQVAAFVAAATTPKAFLRGMWTSEIQRVAKAMGHTLKIRKTFAEDETGILILQLEDECHAVVLFQGVIVNPGDGMVWDYDAYLSKACATVRHLLVES